MVIINDFPLNAEYWRAVDGFQNYEVSTDGRVRNSRTVRIIKARAKPDGRFDIKLSKDKRSLTLYVHRLVATAFCNNENNYNVVDHIERNPSNNKYQNLRWVTMSENSRNASTSIINTSGFPGVYYDKSTKSWNASWQGEGRRRHKKHFNVKTHGDEQAKQMAIDHRRQMGLENGYLNP